jgi:hypothetical protein
MIAKARSVGCVKRTVSPLYAPQRCVARTLLKWVLAAWVLASLLFAHGCHGNEDHELFNVIEWVSGE